MIIAVLHDTLRYFFCHEPHERSTGASPVRFCAAIMDSLARRVCVNVVERELVLMGSHGRVVQHELETFEDIFRDDLSMVSLAGLVIQ
jgi:hypothetical protein